MSESALSERDNLQTNLWQMTHLGLRGGGKLTRLIVLTPRYYYPSITAGIGHANNRATGRGSVIGQVVSRIRRAVLNACITNLDIFCVTNDVVHDCSLASPNLKGPKNIVART